VRGMTSRGLAVLLVLFVLAVMTTCVGIISPFSYRFRITIAVETPQGVVLGASVLETSTIYQPTLLGVPGGRYPSLHGEAVFVDLGQGRHLIGLLAHGPRGEGVDGVMMLPVSAFGLRSSGVGRGQNAHEMAAALPAGSSRELRDDLIPTFVTFSDINDPASAKVVYATGRRLSDCGVIPPGESCQPRDIGPFVIDKIAETFGPGYRLSRVTLEMVPAGTWPWNSLGWAGTPVTRGIEGKVPFLTTHREPLRRMQRDMPPRFQPGFSQFIRE